MGNRIGFVPVSIRIVQGIEQVAEVRVDPGDHGAPLLGLGGQFLKVRLVLVRLVPVGKLHNFLERSMGDLGCEQAEEGLATLVVTDRLPAHKIQSGKGIDVIAVGDFRIIRMILRSRIIWVCLVVRILRHTVGFELESALRPGFGRRVPEGRLKEGMGPHVMQFGHHELITVRSRQSLDIVERRALPGRGTTVAPFAPVTCRVSGLCQNVSHRQVLCPDRLLRIVRVVAVGKGVALVKAGLLGGAGRRADRATITPAEIHSRGRQAVKVRSQHVGLALGLSISLAVWTNRPPPHIVDIEVEDIGPLGTEGKGREQEAKAANKRGDFFHIRYRFILQS